MELLLGAAFQFLRARKGISEWWTVLAVVAAGSLGWFLSDGYAWLGVRDFLRHSVDGMVPFVAGYGGTSTVANVAVKMGMNEKHPLVPVTDSKGG